MKKTLSLAEKMANELLSLMGTKAQVKASEDKKNEAVRIDIETEEETGLLIGRHGETIEAIQSILGMMLKKKTGDWVRIIVDVGGWREKQEERLRDLATQTAERAKETGEGQPLYNLSPAQRRVIHLTLADDPDIETESAGEDEERYLIIRPKK
ncbi:KH domain-containing protein [Candidatus Woesebacteria bacterium]|nr:MAG: KH domain-containing protein [Candidatus Woesebacteria bacterium]